MTRSFNDLVLEWLVKRANAAEMISVDGHGYEGGSTEGGFYDAFNVDITYRTTDGELRWLTVEGEEMQSLWDWVVSGHVVVTDPTDES